VSTQSAYLELVAGPDRLFSASGAEVRMTRADLVGAIERATSSSRRVVVWVHETAFSAWGLPDEPDDLPKALAMPPDARSSPGWVRLSKDVHVAIPDYSGDFAGTATPAELARALAMFRELVGIGFLYSAPSSALKMLETRFHGWRPTREAGVPFAASAFAVPAFTWSRPSHPTHPPEDGPLAQLFDRRGSYLAAWRSAELPDGEWIAQSGPASAIAADAPGYYLVDFRSLGPYVAAQGLHDPFARAPRPRPGAPPLADGRAWVTQPLARLAGELGEEAGVDVVVDRYVIADRKVRLLDGVAARLADARRTLEASADPVAPMVLAMIRDAYVRGTAHLEFGRRPPHPLHRPEWRHTIVDRHVANTYRSLRKSSRRPIVVGGVDGAVFIVSGPDDVPAGLPIGPELGSWRRRGAAVPIARAIAELERGRVGARDLLFSLMAAA